MANAAFHIDPGTMTLRRFLLSVVLNAAINTIIALIINALGVGMGFRASFTFSQCIGFSIFFANIAVLPLYRRAERTAAQLAIIVTAIIAGAVIGTLLGALANGMRPIGFLREHSGLFNQVILFALLFGFLVSYIFISVSLLSEEKMRRLETEKNAVETELRLLQSQMEPHFLFNTLANVRSLIDSDPPKAGDMLETFVAFLRTSLQTSRERTVPLVRELDVVKSYLDLYAMRMGERLHYRIDLPEALRRVPVPPLLIQPLVENAVKHGLEPSVAGGEVTVAATRAGDRIRISVADSGIGIGEKAAGSGIGLENARKRLELLYGERGRLMIEERKPTGVIVTIEVPDEEAARDHRR